MKITPAHIKAQEAHIVATDDDSAKAVMRRYDVEAIVMDNGTALFTITDYTNPFVAREFDQNSKKEKDFLSLEDWMLRSGKTHFSR